MNTYTESERKSQMQKAFGSSESLIDINSIQQVLIQLIESLKMSHNLMDYGITDSVSNFIHELVSQPKIITGYSVLEATSQIITDELFKIVSGFFKKNKEIIDNVFKIKDGENELFYMIVLKEDNIANRSKLNEFLIRYEKTPLVKKFPVIFQYTINDFRNDINGTEIILD